MIEVLKKNIDAEIDMLREIANYTNRLDYATEVEKKQLTSVIDSLRESMKIVNNAIPDILKSINFDNKLPVKLKKPIVETDNALNGIFDFNYHQPSLVLIPPVKGLNIGNVKKEGKREMTSMPGGLDTDSS